VNYLAGLSVLPDVSPVTRTASGSTTCEPGQIVCHHRSHCERELNFCPAAPGTAPFLATKTLARLFELDNCRIALAIFHALFSALWLHFQRHILRDLPIFIARARKTALIFSTANQCW
jgi:hypothetical protein